jgi:putative DNA primase/helicase
MTAAELAAALGGAQREGHGWRCNCPVHGGHSLVVSDGREGRLLVKCWAGCATRDILAELRRLGLLDGEAGNFGARPDDAQIARRRDADARERLRKTALAVDIWGASYPAAGTVVERYLCSRGVALPPPPTLRYHPMHGSYGRHPSGARRPQMIALVEHIEFGPVAVSRTFLAPDGGGKATVNPVRIFTGPVGGGAIRLAPIRPDRPVALGKGIETTLSVMQACHLAGWAALSAIGIEKLMLPPEARTVLICADHDVNGAGERAARRAAKRFISEGRKVRLAMPPQGLDFNDLLMGRASRIAERAQ